MILDEPDEDADPLEDDDVLESYLVPDRPEQASAQPSRTADFADWPPPASMHETAPRLDPLTLAWFRAHHSDWHAGMQDVLNAWVDGRMHATATSEAIAGDETTGG